jgi:hypothetical protein
MPHGHKVLTEAHLVAETSVLSGASLAPLNFHFDGDSVYYPPFATVNYVFFHPDLEFIGEGKYVCEKEESSNPYIGHFIIMLLLAFLF